LCHETEHTYQIYIPKRCIHTFDLGLGLGLDVG